MDIDRRTLARLGVALLAACIVVLGLVSGVGAVAMAVDWDLPARRDLGTPSVLVDRDGTPVYRFAAEIERTPVPISRMADSLADAVVAAEDHRFYEHQGVDPFSVVRAIVRNVTAGTIREGGSTLTQQYVKNAYTGADRTFTRKVREAVLALQFEKDHSKADILEAYLNRVYFGDGAYGAQAAARSYFDADADELTLGQSALLAGLLSAPSDLTPRHHLGRALERRNLVLQRMDDLGMITSRERHEARQEPIELAERDEDPRTAPYYVERVRQQLLDHPDIGPQRLYYGGLRITAALDLDLHTAVREQVRAHLPDDPALDAGVAVVDPATGDVLATYSGRDFADSGVDLATAPSAGRPSGSTFKTFALVAALERDWTLESAYPAPSRVTIGDWSPRGSGGCPTPCSLLEATVHSANTVFAQLAHDVGGESMTGMARRLGSRSRFPDPEQITHVLGPGDVTPLDMASAFATLANDGVACPARMVTEVRTADGATIPPPDPRQPSDDELERWRTRLDELGYELEERDDHGRCYRAVAPSVARSAVHALEQVVGRGTGTRAALADRPVAGKTGTAQNSTMIWFTGTTPQRAISASFGGRDTLVPLRGLPGCTASCFGGQLTARLWRDVAEEAHGGLEPASFGPRLPDPRRVGESRSGESSSSPTPNDTETSPSRAPSAPVDPSTPSPPAPIPPPPSPPEPASPEPAPTEPAPPEPAPTEPPPPEPAPPRSRPPSDPEPPPPSTSANEPSRSGHAEQGEAGFDDSPAVPALPDD